MQAQRCRWATTESLIAYHDREWGVPQHDDRLLFEFLILEGAQAGLSWETVLRKRTAYREAFRNFDPKLVAEYGLENVEALMNNARIIRNRLKIKSAIQNAQAFLQVQKEFGSFDAYLQEFVQGKLTQVSAARIGRVTRSDASDRLSKDLQRRGFTFVGTTICYAFMQAVGIVNDHDDDCFRRRELPSQA